MVLSEYEVAEESIVTMTQALSEARDSLVSQAVFGAEAAQVQKAWDAQLAEKPDLCAAHLRQAATITAAAIDKWEQARNAN